MGYIGKSSDFVSLSVAIFILKVNQPIVHFRFRLPLWISSPRRGPDPALRIDLQRNRVNRFWEFLFRRKKVYLKVFWNGHAVYGFDRINIGYVPRNVSSYNEWLRNVAVVDLNIL